MHTGRVSMMISAECDSEIGEKDSLCAMCAVREASTLAFTPLPSPSERVQTIWLLSGFRDSRKTSPPIFWPCLYIWA